VETLIKRGWSADRVRRFVLIGGTSLGLALLGVGRTVRPVVASVLDRIAACGLSAASPIGWSLPSLLAPRESVGTLGGHLNTGKSNFRDRGGDAYRVHLRTHTFEYRLASRPLI